MRRPFFFRSPRRIGCLRGIDSLRERVEPGAQRAYLLLLPVHDIAELNVRALQERDLGFNPLDFIAGHSDSVTNPRARRRTPTIDTKLVVSR
jgi:hypothetical protein